MPLTPQGETRGVEPRLLVPNERAAVVDDLARRCSARPEAIDARCELSPEAAARRIQ